MKISDIGGECALIRRLTGISYNDPAIIKGVGDDCAVLEYTHDNYLLVTVDMMVENDHFSLDWHTPYQVGKKLMESNVSDIIAMGGKPRWAFVSLALTAATQVEFMDELYRGLYDSARRHSVALIGGDTTHGRDLVFNLALLGDVGKNFVRLRSDAVPGDLLCVTGTLGKSEAGLRLLRNGKNEGWLEGHLEPQCRLEWEGRAIARYARAMIDVSDGLGSELAHICEESNTGGCIIWENIPLSPGTIKAAQILYDEPQHYALSGGEDFELVFTIPPANIPDLRKEFSDFTVVGEILAKEAGIFILKQGHKMELSRGYDHFSE
ncbi:MAG: thiamine-phosphate kinase [Candidatus Hydrogenedentota bacterium]|nr:MAG: thiamine-phosphate kinase [Candidatus Hydrogenedentota bacterium]